jgi:hypothetical protein
VSESSRDAGPPALAGASLTAHLLRGALGFGLIAAALALCAIAGPAALALLAPALLALRGCPTCWLLGLLGAISAGHAPGACAGGGCARTLQPERSCSGEPPRAVRSRSTTHTRQEEACSARNTHRHV